MVLESIRYSRGKLQILNQLRLPHVAHYDEVENARDGWLAIRAMRVRGAPAIAIVAVLSLAVELEQLHVKGSLSSQAEEVNLFIHEKLNYLVTSRPTAVNLHDAAQKLGKVIDEKSAKADVGGADVMEAYIRAAERILIDDVKTNQAIGKNGAEWILKKANVGGESKQVSVLTICNTGSLATGGYGTALGVIRSLHSESSLKHAYFLETRPYNQGSRLTAYELLHDKIPATLITDSMAGALLQLKSSAENIAAVVVGADRVVRSGATANKIGTYALAILAKHHGIKFLVAAPRTSIDMNTKSGEDVIIEERPAQEMTRVTGPVYNGDELDVNKVETVATAAPGIDVWNPAFDVTPPELIDGIITEVGVVEKDQHGRFSFEACFKAHG
ncbi:MAG: S-methyl-5-thioribose-1-phosphate isomerase [Sclerophora amabilis]|nr:MAG: S-methyl-5-thioribose-1-phosphate isomerase [Sclerophora amabilis]